MVARLGYAPGFYDYQSYVLLIELTSFIMVRIGEVESPKLCF